MTIEIGLGLLAAAIPVAALVLKFSGSVGSLQFVKLETEFKLFRREVRSDLQEIKAKLER